jgi:hypothetical protein
LYVSLPYRLVDDWWYVPSQAATAGFVAALFLPTLAGLAGGALESETAVRSGTAAGFLATVIGGMLVVLPAAELQGADALLIAIKNGETSVASIAAASADSALSGTWMPVAAGLLLLCLGPALGAIGGVVFDLWAGTTGRTTRTVHRAFAPVAGLGATVAGAAWAAAWCVQLDAVILPKLQQPVGWTTRNLLASPTLLGGCVAALLLVWALRDTMLLWKRGLRAFAMVWGGSALTLAFAVPISAILLYPKSALTLVPWLVFAMVGVAAIGGTVGAMRSEVELEQEARTLPEFLSHALLTGMVAVSALFYVGVAPTLGTWIVAFPYALALVNGDQLVQAKPESLVSWVFDVHFAALLLVPVVAGVYAVCAGPFWVFVRAYTARRDG